MRPESDDDMRERCSAKMQRKTGVQLSAYALFAFVDRLADVPAWGKVIAVLTAAVSFLLGDVFLSALALLVASGIVDYVVGRRAAKSGKGSTPFDPAIAHAGAVSKIAGVAILLLVRGAEGWAGRHDILDTRGMIATALTMALFAVDLDGIQEHREALGARPIPGLSKFTRWLSSMIDRVLPTTPGGDG